MTLKRFIYSLFLCPLISAASMFQDNPIRDSLEIDIVNNYNSLLANQVTNDLLAYHEIYKVYPNKYWAFLNDSLSNNWDFDATARALIGNKIFKSLSDAQFKALSRNLEVTLMRYAFESLSFYDKQKFNVIDIEINHQENLVWLKINMDSPRFPDIHLDLLLKRMSDNSWRGIDFKFKGLSYVSLKKNSFRQDFKDIKFQAVLKKLENKNKAFFEDLCPRESNYKDPKKPPCL